MKYPFHHNAHKEVFKNARSLKGEQTPAEKAMWRRLRNRRVIGKKFRRQHPIAGFIVDFYCHECQLVIEVDGPIHQKEDHATYDIHRTGVLESLGLRLIRFSNDQVLNDPFTVLAEIKKELSLQSSPPSPPRRGAGGEVR